MREPAIVRRYQRRAESFYKAAQLLDIELDVYGPSVGLLAVHSGIALTDAVLVSREGRRSKAGDHGTAAQALAKLCTTQGLDESGLKHLRELLSNKTRFSYREAEVQEHEFKKAKLRMEQFFKWALSTFPELARTDTHEPTGDLGNA